MNLDRLFRPKSIAVYGGKWSDYVVQQCRKLGFSGEIWHVNPTRGNCINSTDKIGGKSIGALIINGKLKAVKTIIAE